MSRPGLHHCTHGPKTRYRNRSRAIKAISYVGQWQRKMGADQVVRRAYRCPSCGGFHLTSQP